MIRCLLLIFLSALCMSFVFKLYLTHNLWPIHTTVRIASGPRRPDEYVHAMTEKTSQNPPPAGLLRRLLAIFYDGLLLAGLLFVAALPTAAFSIEPGGLGARLLFLYMLAVAFGFFGWFWTHGGQTLGMRAWRLRLVDDAGGPVGWGRALRRYACAMVSWLALGLGFIWCLIDREGLTWHDRCSGTRLVRLPPRSADTAQAREAQGEEDQQRQGGAQQR